MAKTRITNIKLYYISGDFYVLRFENCGVLIELIGDKHYFAALHNEEHAYPEIKEYLRDAFLTNLFNLL